MLPEFMPAGRVRSVFHRRSPEQSHTLAALRRHANPFLRAPSLTARIVARRAPGPDHLFVRCARKRPVSLARRGGEAGARIRKPLKRKGPVPRSRLP